MTYKLEDYRKDFERMLEKAGFVVVELMKVDKVMKEVSRNLEISDLSSRYDPITRAQLYECHARAGMPLFTSFLISSGRNIMRKYNNPDLIRKLESRKKLNQFTNNRNNIGS